MYDVPDMGLRFRTVQLETSFVFPGYSGEIPGGGPTTSIQITTQAQLHPAITALTEASACIDASQKGVWSAPMTRQ